MVVSGAKEVVVRINQISDRDDNSWEEKEKKTHGASNKQ